jgi:hypothetical protein
VQHVELRERSVDRLGGLGSARRSVGSCHRHVSSDDPTSILSLNIGRTQVPLESADAGACTLEEGC